MTRISSLDGLRGVAALVVLIHHAVLTVPMFADITAGRAHPPVGTWEWWFSVSPLRLIWGGSEAVIVFFVLSGFVLAPVGGRAVHWCSYYAKRSIRLYLPAWASLVLAVLVVLSLPAVPVVGASWWMNAHLGQDPWHALTAAPLVLGTPQWINSPLWSIRIELWFSLLLPVFAVAIRWAAATRLRAVGTSVVLVGVMSVGCTTQNQAARFLPVFLFGMMLAHARERIAGRTRSFGVCAWTAVAAATVAALSASWVLEAVPGLPAFLLAAAQVAQVGGAMALVIIAAHAPVVARQLGGPVLKWLGGVSFSLYLTHDPVLTAITFAAGGHPPLWFVLLAVVPTALVVAQVFAMLVERPSHRLARTVGRRLERRRSGRSRHRDAAVGVSASRRTR